ncbi:hypothetical protein niasHT_031592 [Heterodera trifolii]|uniref:Uncharacterized protein n=1 Tax=Heterodera trifolii TaxID=157864 RepID=A0ABD2J2E7_9BILA
MPMLLAECKIMKSAQKTVKNKSDDSAEIYLEVYKHCEALKKGQILANGIPEQFAKKIEKTLQKYGQKLVEFFKKRENEAKITVDGKCGTIADILARADKHPKLRQIVKMFDILRKWVGKMSAGPAKEAIQNVLLASHSVPMPSDMVQLFIQLWHASKFGDIPQQFRSNQHPRSHARRRRKRDHPIAELILFLVAFTIKGYFIGFLGEVLEFGAEFIDDYSFVFSCLFGFFIFAFLRQQHIYQEVARNFG